MRLNSIGLHWEWQKIIVSFLDIHLNLDPFKIDESSNSLDVYIQLASWNLNRSAKIMIFQQEEQIFLPQEELGGFKLSECYQGWKKKDPNGETDGYWCCLWFLLVCICRQLILLPASVDMVLALFSYCSLWLSLVRMLLFWSTFSIVGSTWH